MVAAHAKELAHVQIYTIGTRSHGPAMELLRLPVVAKLIHYCRWPNILKDQRLVDCHVAALNAAYAALGMSKITAEFFCDVVQKVNKEKRSASVLYDPKFQSFRTWSQTHERTEEHRANHMIAISNPTPETRAAQSRNMLDLLANKNMQEQAQSGVRASAKASSARSAHMRALHDARRAAEGRAIEEALPPCSWCGDSTLGRGNSDTNKLCATCSLRTDLSGAEPARCRIQARSLKSLRCKLDNATAAKRPRLEQALAAAEAIFAENPAPAAQ
jgi:hypothetical protein